MYALIGVDRKVCDIKPDSAERELPQFVRLPLESCIKTPRDHRSVSVSQCSLASQLPAVARFIVLIPLLVRVHHMSAQLFCWVRGFIFCCLMYGSICSGFLFLYCPLLPLLLLHQKLFRRLTDIIFAAWELYPTALLECILGTKIVVTGDPILPQDMALIVMNHHTRLDWKFLWAAMFHACQPMAHRLKIVLKASIRHIPGPGWVMQMAGFLYIHRRWERDKALMQRTLDYLRDIGYTCQILLFPEGTDMNNGSLEKSHIYASLHNLPRYFRVLHPKTTGFAFLARRMKKNGHLDAIYDITVAYPQTMAQSEIDVVKGIFPQEVHFSIKRIPGSIVPETQDELKEWLTAIWKQKEEKLGQFYECGYFVMEQDSDISRPQKNLQSQSKIAKYPNVFGKNALPNNNNQSVMSAETVHSNVLYLALMFWTLLCILALYSIVMIYAVQIYALINILLFVCVSLFTEGINQIEISLYQIKKNMFSK